VFPFGRGNVAELLEMLAEANFIERYECNGKRYIQIRSFTKHQHPNVREPASNIPAPALHVHARAKDVLGTTLKDASPPGAVAVTVTVTEAVEREREMHALHASLSFSRKLESIVQEIEADPLYASRKDIRKVAAKRRTWLGRDPTKREILSWLNSEKAEVNDDGGSSEQIARVVANLGRDN
jgi:hypothetical protein